MPKLISTEISESVLRFTPEDGPLSFGITIYNNSDQFASFQVELVAAGATPGQRNWYRLSPSVSAKIPPGDQTQFQAHLLSVPPVPGGFTGLMNLTVKVYSTELRDEDRKDLRLIITGEGLLLPKVTPLKNSFKARPQEVLDILATVSNPNRKSLEVGLEVTGLAPGWFPEGTQKRVALVPGEEKQVAFVCQLPSPIQALQDIYLFGLEVIKPANAVPPQSLHLEILAQGFVDFQATPLEQWIPAKAGRWLNPFDDEADYTLTFSNQSNVTIAGQVEIVDEEVLQRAQRKRPQLPLPKQLPSLRGMRLGRGKSARPAENPVQPAAAPSRLPAGVTLDTETVTVAPGEQGTLTLMVRKRLPWVGLSRLQRLQVQARLADAPLDLRNDTQTVELYTQPIIPVWLQLLVGAAGVLLLGLIWWLIAQRGHTQPVRAVQFNGIGTEVVSGSSDETMRRWRVSGRRLQPRGILERGDQAVQTLRYRPFNNNWVAAGLENGAIQLRSTLSRRQSTLESERGDRVFDLAFDQDARTLWSAHGSGQVLGWTLLPDLGVTGIRTPSQRIDTEVAASALALGGDTGTLLAVGGRFQQLVLVDLETADAFEVTYPREGGQTDFINSLATAEEQPALLAAGDSDGFVSLWDLDQCLLTGGSCQPIDQWQAHGGDAVRSVALSSDGCAVVSSGDDGRVQHWPLTGAGERLPEAPDGRTLHRTRLPVNAVDVLQQQQRLLVVSGGDDKRVRLHRVRLQANDRCRVN